MVYFEVRRGLYHRDSRALLEDFEQVARRMRWREFDRRMWETAAALWARMRRTGRPASDADVLIAAFAAVLGASVVTHNTRHTSRRLAFQRTTGASEVTE